MKLPTSYSGLLKTHMIRPIHGKVAYDNTIEVLDSMAGHKLNAEQEDYFEALSSLLEVLRAPARSQTEDERPQSPSSFARRK